MELTILEKIEKATDNVSKVYNRGYSNGLKAGSAAGGGSSGVDEASINTALDELLAIQADLTKPTFTVKNDDLESTYDFDEGMTWKDYCNSDYNNPPYYDAFSCADDGTMYYYGLKIRDAYGHDVNGNDKITKYMTYALIRTE